MKRKTDLRNHPARISVAWLCAAMMAITTRAVSATELLAHLEGSNLVLSWLTNHVEHWLNGGLGVSYELNSPAFDSLVAGSPTFSSYAQFAKARAGYIAFQNWTPEVWFRNIKIRRLPPR